ncbi:unnamed protein product [Pleuronectes platessa]|uniref:Uncharacterized protein n=1 Tax=Pleuronectes platessa TaxID=8262 RepID=A0A9N7YQG3_PLEPL|nr:unnamed protein product [Pleuronectes platessa]
MILTWSFLPTYTEPSCHVSQSVARPLHHLIDSLFTRRLAASRRFNLLLMNGFMPTSSCLTSAPRRLSRYFYTHLMDVGYF